MDPAIAQEEPDPHQQSDDVATGQPSGPALAGVCSRAALQNNNAAPTNNARAIPFGRLPLMRPSSDSRDEIPSHAKYNQQYWNRAWFTICIDLAQHKHEPDRNR
jgi:hypothetical protein